MALKSNKSDKNFTLDKTWLRNSFSRAAHTYNQVAVLQKEVAGRLVDRLEYIKVTPQTVLDLGSGTGFCSNLLLNRYPKSSILSLDISHGMLVYARAQRGWMQRIRYKQNYICGDAEKLPLKPDSMDMVLSSLALQWCFDLSAVFNSLYKTIKPGGLLMFATMGPDTLKELRQSWSGVDDKPHVSGFYDMHDIGDTLLRAGFSDPVMDVERITLTYATVFDLMKDLKSLGSRNALFERQRGLTGKEKFKQMLNAYEKYRNDELLPASYEIVYGHAWVPEEKRKFSHDDSGFPIPVISKPQ